MNGSVCFVEDHVERRMVLAARRYPRDRDGGDDGPAQGAGDGLDRCEVAVPEEADFDNILVPVQQELEFPVVYTVHVQLVLAPLCREWLVPHDVDRLFLLPRLFQSALEPLDGPVPDREELAGRLLLAQAAEAGGVHEGHLPSRSEQREVQGNEAEVVDVVVHRAVPREHLVLLLGEQPLLVEHVPEGRDEGLPVLVLGEMVVVAEGEDELGVREVLLPECSLPLHDEELCRAEVLECGCICQGSLVPWVPMRSQIPRHDHETWVRVDAFHGMVQGIHETPRGVAAVSTKGVLADLYRGFVRRQCPRAVGLTPKHLLAEEAAVADGRPHGRLGIEERVMVRIRNVDEKLSVVLCTSRDRVSVAVVEA
mmetsp:Transcript_91412/g.153133  ORF Transcript_91412/g.153133 Transcript_91412/m.153133 type:complete len:367 (-) Transcript_91412:315-1415(-)